MLHLDVNDSKSLSREMPMLRMMPARFPPYWLDIECILQCTRYNMYPVMPIIIIRTIQCFNVKTSLTYQMVPVYTTNRRVKAATRPMKAQCSFIYDVDPMPIKNPLSIFI